MLDRKDLRATSRLNGVALWSTVTLCLNGAVFVMLGLEMRQVLQRVDGYSRWDLLGYVVLLTLTLLALRLIWTLLLVWLSSRNRAAGGEVVPNFTMLVVTVLCGVRGSLALSAALAPLLAASGAAMPGRDVAIFLAAGTIAMSLLTSGLVMQFLKFDRTADASAVLSLPRVHVAIAKAALKVIDDDRLTAVSAKVHEWAATWKRLYESRIAAMDSTDGRVSAVHRRDLAAQRELSMKVLLAQRHELVRLQNEGALTYAVLQEVEVDLDLAAIALDKLEWRGAGGSPHLPHTFRRS